MKNLTLSILFCCCASLLPAQQIWYVNYAALGANNGSNWADAYKDLQNALAEAHAGDQIWVAKGTYFPTDGIDRAISFNLPTGVGLYGGFEGRSLNQRNAETNATVLSADIGVVGVRTDNSYHVVTIYRGDGLYRERLDNMQPRYSALQFYSQQWWVLWGCIVQNWAKS